jgi:8-oxo-dGTP diphosphatase
MPLQIPDQKNKHRMINRFNIRVYGICFNTSGELLIADERIKGHRMTKFPGGGLEFGEGTLQCVQREFIEETGQAIEVIRHFYTTDFFVPSAFNPSSQVISIYYEVKFTEAPRFAVGTGLAHFPEGAADSLLFRWIPSDQIHPGIFTFPADQKVAELLQKKRS